MDERSQREDQRAGVRATLRAMENAWKRGDFDEFMSAYWNSPNLVFFSNGRRLEGHTTLANVMRQRYAQGMSRITGRPGRVPLHCMVGYCMREGRIQSA
jgi:hypothetical protein